MKKSNDLLFKILGYTSLVMLFMALSLWMFRFLVDRQSFGDFAETLSFCIVKNPYTGEYGPTSIYPPFAFLPFYVFALICKGPITEYLQNTITLNDLVIHPLYLLSFFLFYTICMIVIMFLTKKITKFNGWKLVFVYIFELCFSPILFCMFRANNIIFAVMFVMLFFWLYDSEKRWCREVANVCLACAIGVKLYPILIAIFFVKDRRWMDLVKTILYAVVILVVPFVFIDGGFSNIGVILNTFGKFNNEADRALSLTNISLDSLSAKFCNLLTVSFGWNTAPLQSILSSVLRYGIIAVSVFCMILSKNSKHKFKPILLNLLTYALFQGVSYAYTFTFLIIPILFYFVEFENLSKADILFYGICFLIIALPIFTIMDYFVITQITSVVLVVKLVIDIIAEFCQSKKNTVVTKE